MLLKKDGMTNNTKITAFCDGAISCWNIVHSLEVHCVKASQKYWIDTILDSRMIELKYLYQPMLSNLIHLSIKCIMVKLRKLSRS